MNYNTLTLIVLYVGCFATIVLAAATQFNAELAESEAESDELNREVWIFVALAMLCLGLSLCFVPPAS